MEKISFRDGKIHFREERETGMDLYRIRKGDLLTSKINIHQGALAIAACDAALLAEQKNKGSQREFTENQLNG